MATTRPPAPLVNPQQPLSNRPVVEDDNNYTVERLQTWYEQHKKTISTALTIVIVIGAAAFAYLRLYKAPREAKAADKVYFAQEYFSRDSLDKALAGDGQHLGFIRVMKEYSGTPTANLCHYYAGMCYLKTGDFKKAIKQLEDFDGHGTMVATAAYGALGNAYMEDGNTKKGIDNYEKAVKNENDVVQTPMYLYNLAAAYQKNNQPDNAKKAYERIRDEFPQSQQARDVERYLAQLGVLN